MHTLLIDWLDTLAHAVDLSEEDDTEEGWLCLYAALESLDEYPLQPCLPEGMY